MRVRESYPSKKESLKGYFSVNADGGLRLRENPNIQSKVILTIPESKIVNILEEVGEIETNDDKKGKWVKVEYGRTTGYVFSPFLGRVKRDLNNFKGKSIKLSHEKNHTKIFETLIESKLMEPYDQSKDRRGYQSNEFQLEDYAARNDYSVISISPRKESCAGYLHSYCYNFILKNDNVINTDMNGESYGELTHISKKAAFFTIYGGEGDECGGALESHTVAFVFKTKKALVARSGSSETCPNECPYEKPKVFTKTIYEYLDGGGTPSDSELRGIFK
ncbi:SH3 domain protein [Leptospira interrogans str. 2006001854]|uniref:SH3 domain protein n=1 Tax=Leptospira interrogans str. 2006001854 TaxID=1001590 RepID=M6GHF1_LEPIR|nr:SH3 domain protein [Leptospira interrogans str. 2006001854]